MNQLLKCYIAGSEGEGIGPIVCGRLEHDILVHSEVQVWLVPYNEWGHLIFKDLDKLFVVPLPPLRICIVASFFVETDLQLM